MANITEFPAPIHRFSLADLADEYGDLAARIAALKERQAAVKADIIVCGETRIVGARFKVAVSQATSWRPTRRASARRWARSGVRPARCSRPPAAYGRPSSRRRLAVAAE